MDAIRPLYIVVPVFASDVNFVFRRTLFFINWLRLNWSKVAPDVREIHPILLAPTTEFKLRRGVSITFPEVSVDDGKIVVAGVPKGTAVRLALVGILDEIDSRGVDARADALIVQIDGSGAFDFGAIRTVVEMLTSQDKEVILGNRTSDPARFMDSEERVSVELFENFLLENWIEKNHGRRVLLVDGQAGCWGLKARILRLLPLTAPGFELEFDLLSSVSMMNIDFGFTEPLKKGDRMGLSYHTTPGAGIDHREAVKKMPFIAHKLGMSASEVGSLLNQYLTERDRDGRLRRLPNAYVELLSRHFLKRT